MRLEAAEERALAAAGRADQAQTWTLADRDRDVLLPGGRYQKLRWRMSTLCFGRFDLLFVAARGLCALLGDGFRLGTRHGGDKGVSPALAVAQLDPSPGLLGFVRPRVLAPSGRERGACRVVIACLSERGDGRSPGHHRRPSPRGPDLRPSVDVNGLRTRDPVEHWIAKREWAIQTEVDERKLG